MKPINMQLIWFVDFIVVYHAYTRSLLAPCHNYVLNILFRHKTKKTIGQACMNSMSTSSVDSRLSDTTFKLI